LVTIICRHYNLGIGLTAKGITLLPQDLFYFKVIVYFPVVDNGIPVQIVHGLRTSGAKVNNGQTAVAKAGGIIVIDPMPFSIGSAMDQHPGHLFQAMDS
jgi:uncharacterized membrane protein